MATGQVELRLIELETKVSKLADQVTKLSEQSAKVTDDASTPWWKHFVGIYKDDPAFDEAERYYLEHRASLDRDDRGNAS